MADREIRVDGAGDARANGVYALCGAQDSSPRWRHVNRSWLCILRDGSNWWIGDETAAREDLYWMDAAAPGPWNVCPCDDRSHRHFKGSAPAPALSWHDPRAPAPACDRRIFATEKCPVCLAPPVEAARAPCGHVACALCLARARAHASPPTGGADGCVWCPLCRAPFALEGATHLATNRPLLEALPVVARDGEQPLVRTRRARAFSNLPLPSTRAAAARGPAPTQLAPNRQRPSLGRRLRERLAALLLGR